jgi:hypothetical protein
MRAWCPRCDAVRPGETTCPVCATPLATLDDSADAEQPSGLPPPPAGEPAPPSRPPRLRVALAAATLVVAGLAFVAGRSLARPAAGEAAREAPATSTTAPDEPGASRRQLGWSARADGLSITAVDAVRVANEQRETVAAITFRVQGVPGDQRVLALRGLRLLDSGGGVYASVEQHQLGQEGGTPVEPVEGRPGTYRLVTGPAPRLSSLARIELTAVVAVRPHDQTITLETAGAWPPGPGLRRVDPGPRDSVQDDLGFTSEGPLRLQVTSAFVREGQALVVIDASSGFRGIPGELLPLGAELRAGERVLCSRTSLLGEDSGQQSPQGIVLSCPTRPVPRLTVALGVGARRLPLDVTLTP